MSKTKKKGAAEPAGRITADTSLLTGKVVCSKCSAEIRSPEELMAACPKGGRPGAHHVIKVGELMRLRKS